MESKTPWTWDTNDVFQMMVYDVDGNPIAQVISKECEADARLICDAVEEFIARHRMVDITTYDRILTENDHLRDLVRRMAHYISVGAVGSALMKEAHKALYGGRDEQAQE